MKFSIIKKQNKQQLNIAIFYGLRVNLCIRHHILIVFSKMLCVCKLKLKREILTKSEESEPICLFKMQKVNKISIK